MSSTKTVFRFLTFSYIQSTRLSPTPSSSKDPCCFKTTVLMQSLLTGEILLKVALNTINQTKPSINMVMF
jgi:hypothetical protein